MSMLKKTAVAASVIAALSIATTASALPLTQLYFTQDAGFETPLIAFTPGGTGITGPVFGASTGSGAPANTVQSFSWSGGSGTSSIRIDSYNDVTSDLAFSAINQGADNAWNANEFWVIDQLVQTNQTLTVNAGSAIPDPLWIADALANFRVFTDAPRTTLLGEDPNSSTVIEFYETLNTTLAASCDPQNGNLAGTPPCSDVYRIASTELDPISFEKGGYLYTIDFALIPGPSRDANGAIVGTSVVCVGANPTAGFCENVNVSSGGIPDDQIWVFTPEFNPGTSSLFVAARWNASEIPVPAPGTLGLLGLGLLGLGVATRRKFRAA